jgi:hypothetical protein
MSVTSQPKQGKDLSEFEDLVLGGIQPSDAKKSVLRRFLRLEDSSLPSLREGKPPALADQDGSTTLELRKSVQKLLTKKDATGRVLQTRVKKLELMCNREPGFYDAVLAKRADEAEKVLRATLVLLEGQRLKNIERHTGKDAQLKRVFKDVESCVKEIRKSLGEKAVSAAKKKEEKEKEAKRTKKKMSPLGWSMIGMGGSIVVATVLTKVIRSLPPELKEDDQLKKKLEDIVENATKNGHLPSLGEIRDLLQWFDEKIDRARYGRAKASLLGWLLRTRNTLSNLFRKRDKSARTPELYAKEVHRSVVLSALGKKFTVRSDGDDGADVRLKEDMQFLLFRTLLARATGAGGNTQKLLDHFEDKINKGTGTGSKYWERVTKLVNDMPWLVREAYESLFKFIAKEEKDQEGKHSQTVFFNSDRLPERFRFPKTKGVEGWVEGNKAETKSVPITDSPLSTDSVDEI